MADADFKLNFGTQEQNPLAMGYQAPQYTYQAPQGYGNNPLSNMQTFGQSPATNIGGSPDLGNLGLMPENSWMTPQPGALNLGNALPASGPQGMFSGGLNGFLQQKNPDGSTYGGWGSAGLGIASGLANSYLGVKQFGLAKDALKEGKRQFDLNFNSQKRLTNARLEDRQNARIAATGDNGYWESTPTYMNKNGIK